MSIQFAKSLEAAARRLRPWFLPSYRRAFNALVARGVSEHRDSEPIVCCDFADSSIDTDGGRYYYSLVRDLIDAGYFPVFTARRATLSSFGIKKMKSLLLKKRLGVVNSPDELRTPFFLITDNHDSAPPPHAIDVIRVCYERRVCNSETDMAFPYFVHPQIAEKTKLPFDYDIQSPRQARIFFGGNTTQGKYDKDTIRKNYQMLSRRAMLEETFAFLAPNIIHRPSNASTWLSSADFYPFVLFETQHCQIPQDRWLEALSKADFFLACPGVGMPLCHNLIESLAAGTIPILQYADYLTPPLQDGINCMAFTDESSLRIVLQRILTMDPNEILTMRQNVRSYYDENLAPGRFATRLFKGTQTLLINDYRVPR